MSAKLVPPNRGQRLVELIGEKLVPLLRVAKFFELVSENLWDRQYIEGTDTGFDITGPAGLSMVRGAMVPYETDGGAWHLKGNIDYTHDSLTSVSLTLAGVTFKTGPDQGVLGLDRSGTATTQAYVASASSVITVTHSAASTHTVLQINVELDGEPTWSVTIQ